MQPIQEKTRRPAVPWTADELDILKYYAPQGMAKLCEMLPRRGTGSIYRKAHDLQLPIATTRLCRRTAEKSSAPGSPGHYLNTGNFLDRRHNGRFRYEQCLIHREK